MPRAAVQFAWICRLLASFAASAQQLWLRAPAESVVGASLIILPEAATDPRNFVTIVAAGNAEGKYSAYQFTRKKTVGLLPPVTPGEYDIRLLAAERPYPTLWHQPPVFDGVKARLFAAVIAARTNIHCRTGLWLLSAVETRR